MISMINIIHMIPNQETKQAVELVKTSRNGRVHYSREQREQVLELFEQSGMSGKAFAEQHGIKYPTFALWRRQRKQAVAGAGEAEQGFVLAEIGTGESRGGELSLVLPCGSEVRATGESGAELLATLIRRLR